MEVTVQDNDGSSSKVTSDSSIDQFPPRGTKQSDRPDREEAIVDSAVDAANPGNVESTRLADHPTTSFDHSSAIENSKKTDIFDDLYNRNAKLTQCYIEQMMAKQQNGGCFGSHWSRKFMNMSTLCRSPQRSKKSKETEHHSGDVKRNSPVQKKNPVMEWKNPILKLRPSMDTSRRQAQILERHRPGKCVSPWREMFDR